MPADAAEVTAIRLANHVADFPSLSDWNQAESVVFCHDWRGENPDPRRQTAVHTLWSDDRLFVRFTCRFRTLDLFRDSDPNGRRDELWDRDVAEVFLQSDRFGEKYYKEFEVSPNGLWLDLDITPQGKAHIASGMQSRVALDQDARVWTAELAVPIAAITSNFQPDQPWRVNFFRCEGRAPGRFYAAWQPTGTPQPNFHVPQKFGTLRFQR